MTSLREEDFKTMNPASKFVSPRVAPTPPEPARRLGTAPLRMQQQKRPARSPSPSSRWMFSPRKLFSRKSSSSSLRDVQALQAEDERSLRSEGSRSRDISPESLRRFLVDDAPLDHEHEDNNSRPAIYIPEDIVEENEDDDNFATSAVSETLQFTGLSPPPRAHSPAAARPYLTAPAAPTRPPPRLPTLATTTTTTTLQTSFQTNFPLSALYTQSFPRSPDDAASLPGFDLSDDDEDEDEDDEEEEDVDTTAPSSSSPSAKQANPFARNLTAALSTYSLPRTAGTENGKLAVGSAAGAAGMGQQQQQREQGQSVAGVEAGMSSLMLSNPIPDAGLGDLVSELGWMAEVIRGEYV